VTARAERAFPGADARHSAALAGVVAIVGNVAGVLFLHDMPSAYRLAGLGEWALAIRAQPANALASALSFAVGLAALAGWASQLGREVGTTPARRGALFIVATALTNAVGSLLPVALTMHVGACDAGCQAVGVSVLRASLTLDALFNLGLGVGLLLIASSARKIPGTRPLALAAGLLSVPVAAQAVWDPAASLLYVAAPLWLALIAVTSVTWLRSHAA
jgi:hypothetical protein